MKNSLQKFTPFIGLVLFAAALWVLNRELRQYRLHEILAQLHAIPAHRLLLSLGAMAASYLALTCYDFLAFRYIRNDLPWHRIALASFVSYAFSNNVGNTLITGGSLRYRFYSNWGLSALDITKVVAFCAITFWTGLLTIAGISLLFEPDEISSALRLPFGSAHVLGGVFLGLVALYLMLCAAQRRPIEFRGLEFSLPPPGLALAQIAISTFDLAASGTVLFFLLPTDVHLPFLLFLGVYMLAVVAGVMSQVPGGLGVIESLMVFLLKPYVPATAVLGALVIYRLIYYVVPLSLASIVLGAMEFHRRRERVRKIAVGIRNWASPLIPHIMSMTVFVGGAILLFSGATPAETSRLHWLHRIVPLTVVELSHFLGSLAGVALLFLARGLQRRLDAAWFVTVTLLAGGIAFSLLKGGDFEEAIALTVMLAALLPCRRQFYRKASLFDEPFRPEWTALIVIVLAASIWLGFFSHKHEEYSNEFWWRFSFSREGDAPRFLRAAVGAVGLALFFALGRLLHPAQSRPAPAEMETMDRVRSIVRQAPNTMANLALLGDKSFLFSENDAACIMYAVEGRSWVALGDPVGPEEEWAGLIWKFRELTDRHGGWTVFYHVGTSNLHLYIDLGLTLLKLGEEARVPLERFAIEGTAGKKFRYALNRVEKDGGAFEIVEAAQAASILPELRAVSDAWLADKNTREKGFSLGHFDEDYLRAFPMALVRKGGRIVAFANMWLGAGREELSVDLMRYTREAPPGVMDYLFIRLMLWGREQGYPWFNLGMAPLSGLERRRLAPLWSRLGGLVFRLGEHFYNFQGLREYKEKFDPTWEPKYLASPGGMALPRIIVDVAALIAGSKRGVFVK